MGHAINLANVVAENLGQHLVDLRHRVAGADAFLEPGLDHRHRGLDIGTLMVQAQEILPVGAEEMEELIPKDGACIVPSRNWESTFIGMNATAPTSCAASRLSLDK